MCRERACLFSEINKRTFENLDILEIVKKKIEKFRKNRQLSLKPLMIYKEKTTIGSR